jgi:hypothetical protein
MAQRLEEFGKIPKNPITPKFQHLFENTYYLKEIDSKWRRKYEFYSGKN